MEFDETKDIKLKDKPLLTVIEAAKYFGIGQARINTDEAKVYVNDQLIELTALEYRLFLIFANNQGVLLSRQQILDKIWDVDGNFVEDNTLTVYVKRLREKLGNALNIDFARMMVYTMIIMLNVLRNVRIIHSTQKKRIFVTIAMKQNMNSLKKINVLINAKMEVK